MAHFLLKSGLKLGMQRFGIGQPKKILLIHGWLDNSNSFNILAPKLADNGYEATAIDILGHGHSDHAPLSSYNHFSHMVCHVKEVVDSMKESNSNGKISIVGHSMGGAVALMFASTYPELIDRLVMIESIGMVTKPAEDVVKTLRKGIEDIEKFDHTRIPKKVSMEVAVQARVNAVTRYPGDQWISREAAYELVKRGTITHEKNENDNFASIVSFRYDRRLMNTSLVYYTPQQLNIFFESLESEVLIILADQGWPFSRTQHEKNRHILERKKLLTQIRLPGSHHLHLDKSTADATADAVGAFLTHGKNVIPSSNPIIPPAGNA